MHRLTEVDEKGAIATWRAKVAAAGRKILTAAGHKLEGPVAVDLTFRLPRPKTITPAKRPLPHVKPDIDKLARTVLDALTDSGVWGDDAQVVELGLSKAYADHAPAGVTITLTEIPGKELL